MLIYKRLFDLVPFSSSSPFWWLLLSPGIGKKTGISRSSVAVDDFYGNVRNNDWQYEHHDSFEVSWYSYLFCRYRARINTSKRMLATVFCWGPQPNADIFDTHSSFLEPSIWCWMYPITNITLSLIEISSVKCLVSF